MTPAEPAELPKAATGIEGLDEITRGGLPRGRPTLVCGGPGSGKTLLAISVLVNGAERFGEPGVLMTFEENVEDIAKDVASLGFDLTTLVAEGKLAIDYVHIERSEIEETGEYDLEGLFVRLDHAIRSIGAKRVVLDTIESLFGGLSNDGILRAELRRLFRWLKEKGVTTIVTAERGERNADAQWTRGIRLGCRDHARSSRRRSDLDPPTSRREVPWLASRHERVPVSHRPRRDCRAADHVARARPSGADRPGLVRRRGSSIACSVTKASIAAARSWCPAPPAPARRASLRTFWTRDAAGASAAFTC